MSGDGIGQVNMLLCPHWAGRITRVCCPPDNVTLSPETAVTVQTLLVHITTLPVTLREAHPVTGPYPDGVRGVQCDAFSHRLPGAKSAAYYLPHPAGVISPSSLLIPAIR
ncbi:hypothetical protein HTS61_28740 [Escherichia coli]|nr:hypothetical protein [Escherichia coli]